jgi:hypothetical protein
MNAMDLNAGRDRSSVSARALFILQALRLRIRVVGKSIRRVAGRQFAHRQ